MCQFYPNCLLVLFHFVSWLFNVIYYFQVQVPQFYLKTNSFLSFFLHLSFWLQYCICPHIFRGYGPFHIVNYLEITFVGNWYYMENVLNFCLPYSLLTQSTNPFRLIVCIAYAVGEKKNQSHCWLSISTCLQGSEVFAVAPSFKDNKTSCTL